MARPKKQEQLEKIDIQSIIDKIKEEIQTEDGERIIPNIIDFCYDKKYLNLTASNIKLYPLQEAILRVFYRGQEGNENLKLTQEQYDLLKNEGYDYFLDKYHSGNLFRELVLVLGRRAGKDFLTSIIALYETMKLLECPGGCPYRFYGIAEGNPIYILTVATSAEQARILFQEMSAKLQNSEYFRMKIGAWGTEKISLMTSEDRKKKKVALEKNQRDLAERIQGSVIIMSGHSNSDALLGKGIYCVKEDSWVLTKNGMMQIKNIHDCTIIHGIEGERQSDINFDNGIQKTLKFKTQSGNEIEATENHKLYVWDRSTSRCIFKKCKHIKKNDLIVGQYGQNLWGNNEDLNFEWSYNPIKYGEKITCPLCGSLQEQINSQHLKSHNITCKEFKTQYPNYPTRSDAAIRKFNTVRDNRVPIQMNQKLARLLGYFIAEGNNTANSISITHTEKDILEDIYNCASNNFESVSINESKTKHNNPKWKDKYVILINGRKELEFFKHIGCDYVTSERKEIPCSILKSSKVNVIEFLKGYFEGDGCVVSKEVKIFAASTSRNLIYQIYYLLLNMGIFSFIKEKSYDNPKYKNQWLIYIRGYEAIKFAKQIGFIGKRKKRLSKQLIKIGEKRKQKQNAFGFPISDIVYRANMNNKELLNKYKKLYGFYGFSNQNTQSLNTIEKWNKIYNFNKIDNYLDDIVIKKLFTDKVVDINESTSHVYDLHVKSESHSYICNGLINHNSLLLDEVASFKTGGAMSGDRLYAALMPAQAAFNRTVGTDEDGNPIKQLDSKTISISSPRAEEGVFYKLWRDAPEVESRLAFKAPTWKVNLEIPEAMLRKEYKNFTPTEFNMEFGAQFSGMAGEKFIPDQYVDMAFDLGANLGQETLGKPGFIYYAHLDPASRSHNYAMVMLHVEERVRTTHTTHGKPKREKVKYFIVDHIKVWKPGEDGRNAVNVLEVDNYIIQLARNFRYGMVTYDVWNSEHSKQKLRAKGIPTKITPFKAQYKMHIYENLENLLVNNQLALPKKNPHTNLMEMELKCLKRIYTPTGFKIKPDDEGVVSTDDVCDALAGACSSAISHVYTGYAKPVTVYTPQSRDDNRTWNFGSGSMSNKDWQFYHKKFHI